MNNLSKTILIFSIAILGASALGVSCVQANGNDLEVEFETGIDPSTGDPYPLFNQANFMPGGSVTRWVKVTNNSTSTKPIATEAINYPGFPVFPDVTPDIPTWDLSRALEIVIRKAGIPTDLYGGSTGIRTLFQFYEDGETYLSDVANGITQQYEFEISFPADKGDDWQGKTTGFDIIVGFQGEEGGGPTPPPIYVPDCRDGIDNDGDGLIDYPDDLGCDSSEDNDESNGGGGGGGGIPLGLTIQYENSRTSTTTATITWLTSYKSTSRVIYDKVPCQFNLSVGEPGYGYTYYSKEYDTPASDNGVTGHSITITGLTSGTTYYYRTVSHASPDTIGTEHSFTTLGVAGDTTAEADAGDDSGDGDGDGAGDGDGDGDGAGEGDIGDGDTGDGSGDDSGDIGDEGYTGDTGDEGDTGAGDTGGESEDEFEYGDNIWEHQGDEDLLSIIDDELDGDAGDDSKFLASIATFFGDLEGWRLILVFLLWIILILIIIRLIKAWIDRKKNNQ